MKKKLTKEKATFLCGKKLKKRGIENEYFVEFKDKTKLQICDWYDRVRAKAYEKNFNGNPVEQNSFMLITLDGDGYYVAPPKFFNGDANWTAYFSKNNNYTNSVYVGITKQQ